jgi:CMP-N,N'-diacetyllegionaminic acid synthase
MNTERVLRSGEMYKGKNILALIPARGGSKGLHRKNIRQLINKPLIAWSIDQARASNLLDKIVVSTEDEEIADVARRYGADVPFLRPQELASDTAKSIDVIEHAIDFLHKGNLYFDYIALLEPTSPLRETRDIDECIRTLISRNDAKSIVSIAKLESGHPDFNVVIDERSGFIRKIDGSAEFAVVRRQDLRKVYFFDGTIYCSEINSLLLTRTFYHDATLAYPVPKWKSIEIDDMSDFICSEALLKARQEGLLK